MRKGILVLLFVVFAFAAVKAVEVANHTVVKGDTLWDISGHYYNDPWKWQAIWNANKAEIADPNLIYPDQSFVIPDASQIPEDMPKIRPEEVKVEQQEEAVKPEPVAEQPAENVQPEPAAEEASAEDATEEIAAEPAPEQEVIEELAPDEIVTSNTPASRYISAESFVVSSDWKADGHITGDKDKKLLISAGDTVYVNLGSNKVKPGDKCIVYRIIGRVRDQDTGDYLGYEVRRIARLEMTKGVGDLASAAKVTVSYDSLQISDLVKIINTSDGR